MWPVFVFIFFIFLVQDASVFLNISAAIVGFLCKHELTYTMTAAFINCLHNNT